MQNFKIVNKRASVLEDVILCLFIKMRYDSERKQCIASSSTVASSEIIYPSKIDYLRLAKKYFLQDRSFDLNSTIYNKNKSTLT